MRVGSLVTWKYTDDRLFIVVTMVKKTIDGTSVGVMGVRSGTTHNMFVSDLEVVCK